MGGLLATPELMFEMKAEQLAQVSSLFIMAKLAAQEGYNSGEYMRHCAKTLGALSAAQNRGDSSEEMQANLDKMFAIASADGATHLAELLPFMKKDERLAVQAHVAKMPTSEPRIFRAHRLSEERSDIELSELRVVVSCRDGDDALLWERLVEELPSRVQEKMAVKCHVLPEKHDMMQAANDLLGAQ